VNKENSNANNGLNISVSNIEKNSPVNQVQTKFKMQQPQFPTNASGIMGEQSFSIDNCSVELSKAEAEQYNNIVNFNKVFALKNEEEGRSKSVYTSQNTSRFREQDEAEDNLKNKVLELQDETKDDQKQIRYWKTKLSLIQQDLGDKLCDKDKEISSLKFQNQQVNDSLKQALDENTRLHREIKYCSVSYIILIVI
jgi:hypothetical protein